MVPKNIFRKFYNYFETEKKIIFVYSRNGIFLIDRGTEDFILQVYWWIDSKGYASAKWTDGRIVRLHRFILNPEKGLVCDHINRNKLDNRIKNLRAVTNQENILNQNSKGYYFSKRERKWKAQLSLNYKTISLGTFDSEEEAISARKMGINSLYKERKSGIIKYQKGHSK